MKLMDKISKDLTKHYLQGNGLTANDITNILVKNLGEGGTVLNGELIEHKEGYQVGIKEYGKFKQVHEMTNYIHDHELNDYGYWYDNGYWYLDYSIMVKDLEEAITLGKQNNELAIFCWKTKTSITL